ncbi:glycosyltransferase family 4 protein [Alteromonas sp. ASW11-36]|uniref:Glycosyltransferase family 4 protein n=1 Tax=Alteromonas arenosi TaxID=3055817 RepID=A0ABT7SY17_9ALTE|nr:glycosyltransferase family 4 protein [Alteromonas sp. ASW11-36]MDM7861088.1 glycosyltransferase family 4 protein [Alteromonas sp. ASW11-36]
MQVVVIGYVWPEPNSSAAGQNMLNLLEAFVNAGWNTIFASAAAPSKHAIDLNKYGVRPTTIELNNSSFDAFIQRCNPDIVIFDRFMTEEQFSWRVKEHAPDALRVLNTEDLHALRDARQQQYKQNKDDIDLHTALFYREIASILRSDLTLLVSSYEQQFITTEFPVNRKNTWHFPLLPALSSGNLTPSYTERRDFIFIGNFRHAPNWDAVLRLKQLWPRIRRRVPNTNMLIYGAYPPKKATQLHNEKDGFLVKGWAEDAQAVLRNARVCAAPLNFGAGVKGKFLDAFQAQTPSITTTVGIEGITSPEHWPGIVTDNDEAFVDAAEYLYNNAEPWHLAQKKIAALEIDADAKQHHQAALIQRLTDAKLNLTQLRQDNFVGAMLHHHTLASTRYMAQWIEAKNKYN